MRVPRSPCWHYGGVSGSDHPVGRAYEGSGSDAIFGLHRSVHEPPTAADTVAVVSPLSDGADPLPDAAVLDAADPLAGFREAFVHADDEPDLIYLDGNLSLIHI